MNYYEDFKCKYLSQTLVALRAKYGRDHDCGGMWVHMVEPRPDGESVRCISKCKDCLAVLFDRVVHDPSELLEEETS